MIDTVDDMPAAPPGKKWVANPYNGDTCEPYILVDIDPKIAQFELSGEMYPNGVTAAGGTPSTQKPDFGGKKEDRYNGP